MLFLMILLTVAGITLFLAAPFIPRFVLGPGRDPIALVRMLQLVAIALLIGAILTRPYNRDTTAIPPSPDAPEASPR